MPQRQNREPAEAPLVPPQNAQVIERRFGLAGKRFLQELPERLAGAADRWHLTLEERLPIGIGGFLVSARTADGTEAVLKLSPTGGAQERANELEAWALDRWRGDGAVRLYRDDPPAGALLIERCVPGTTIDTLPDDEMVLAGCAVARRLHRSPDAEDERELSNGITEVAERLAVFDEEMKRIRRPLTPAAERTVLEAHEELTHGDTHPVVCHGDLNPGNLLAAQRAPWLAIDPLPVLAPAAYDAVSLVWCKREWVLDQPDPAEVLRRRTELAADALGVTERQIWAWALARAAFILIDRSGWGGYDEDPLVRVTELLCARPPGTA